MKKLPASFYQQKDVVKIARELLGKILVTKWEDTYTTGRIVETEAYNGIGDKASHAFGGRRTNRNDVMYGKAGVAYVYLCYGLHHLFNVVTNAREFPHAVLIRALEPLEGIEQMLKRTGKRMPDKTLTRGPGNLSRSMGIYTSHNGFSLMGNEIFIADDGFRYPVAQITASPRIGVAYAGEDAKLPYRFFIKGNIYVSGSKA
jgi:DNA-3-methyladenine glycosylase